MTDHDLATLLRAHVGEDEPHRSLSVDRAIALGRRRLARRRNGCYVAGAAAAVAVATLATMVPWHHPDGARGIDPATAAALDAYDAQRMPGLIDQRVRPVLERSVDDLRRSTFSAEDGYGQPLEVTHYDLAASMSLLYTTAGDDSFSVYLAHARSEAEGPHRKLCAEEVESGYEFSCSVETVGGDTVITSVAAVRRMDDGLWAALTRDELRTGDILPTDPVQEPLDRAEVYFQRNVKVIHSETFVTDAQEVVRAPDLASADSQWRVPVDDLQEIARDPVLVIPAPPVDEKGCPATVEKGFSCG